jgi:D-glycero-beta-D-manno-heptose-7-phosphate kinase
MTAEPRAARLNWIVRSFAGKRVLVIGDMVLDEYIVGVPARISREAPVLVLHHSDEFVRPGGAANVAHNLAALGAETCVSGVIGDDTRGAGLREFLTSLAIQTDGLIVDATRGTATKTRVVGRGKEGMQQQIVRIDRVDRSSVSSDVAKRMIGIITDHLDGLEAIVISDYENGVISPAVLREVLTAARERDLVVVVDSHGDLLRFKGVTAATPNQPEAEGTLGRLIHNDEELEAAGEELRRGMDAQGVLLTRGSLGMSLFERDEPSRHLAPTNLREVFDPTGAGDTACAVFTLALLAEASMHEAAILSNIASGEVVRKLGAATLSVQQLDEAALGFSQRSAP